MLPYHGRMEILEKVLLVLHFVGLASILGGVLVQAKLLRSGARLLPAIMHGAWLQLLTGLALVGVISATDNDLDNTKIAVKLTVLLVIVVLAFINRTKATPASWVVPVIGLLTLSNIVIAVFWQ